MKSKKFRVGGPLLGPRRDPHPPSLTTTEEGSANPAASAKVPTAFPHRTVPHHHAHHHHNPFEPISWFTFEPLVSDPVTPFSSSSSLRQRWVLLPHTRFVTVLSYQTGQRLGHILPTAIQQVEGPEKPGSVLICSVTLATWTADHYEHSTSSSYQVLLMGCDDGTLREFDLRNLTTTTTTSSSSTSWAEVGPYGLTGPLYRPGRLFRVAGPGQALRHLAAVEAGPQRGLVYAVVDRPPGRLAGSTTDEEAAAAAKSRPEASGKVRSRVLRLVLPAATSRSDRARASSASRTSSSLPPSTTTTTTTEWMDWSQPNSPDTWRIHTLDDKLRHYPFTSAPHQYPASSKRGGGRSSYPRHGPFSLQAVGQSTPLPPSAPAMLGLPDQSCSAVFVVLASSTLISVYYDVMAESTLQPPPLSSVPDDEKKEKKTRLVRFAPVLIDIPERNPITALAVSPDGKDVACGHWSGSIRIMHDVLTGVAHYSWSMGPLRSAAAADDERALADSMLTDKPKHPSKTALIRKLHWHAHPVVSMVYPERDASSASVLYSGGDESVLVSWQLLRGAYKPSDVLPRLALGGIVHLCAVPSNGDDEAVLVYCADNSLQLFAGSNRSLLWKLQGLAASPSQVMLPARPSLQADPGGKASSATTLVLTGLSQVPGYIHWYDPLEQKVISSLEVAPYNRVSRTDAHDAAMPSPTVTHAAWSASGQDLVTLDAVPTENASMGAVTALANGSTLGVITTIRFWSRVDATYQLIASMAYPHGSSNTVSALTLSPDGKFACSVSNDEKAFRLWRREPGAEGSLPQWECQYRISFPSGYSNSPVGPAAVTFSSDASILAMAFGSMITLWDHHQVSLLTSLRHVDPDDESPVVSLQFLRSEMQPDLLMSQSATGVGVQSIHGHYGPVGKGWSWVLPSSQDGADDTTHPKVCVAEYVPAGDVVVMAIYHPDSDQSQLVLLDAVTGDMQEAHNDGTDGMNSMVAGEMVGISCLDLPRASSNWTTPTPSSPSPLRLLALTKAGELILWSRRPWELTSSPWKDAMTVASRPPPSLATLLETTVAKKEKPKRARTIWLVTDLARQSSSLTSQASKKIKWSLDYFGSLATTTTEEEEEDEKSVPKVALPTVELPSLRGAFARAFVARHLQPAA